MAASTTPTVTSAAVPGAGLTMARSTRWVSVLLMVGMGWPWWASGATITLDDLGAQSASWWYDVAQQEYAQAYQSSYSYAAATVTVSYDDVGTRFAGTLTATNLKPNFAYQIKLDGGGPESYPVANENLGFAGRWWEEERNGTTWGSGGNLNDQPDAPGTHADQYPLVLSSNDLTYLERRHDLYLSTDHPAYRYTGYLLLGYVVTDAAGDAGLRRTTQERRPSSPPPPGSGRRRRAWPGTPRGPGR